MRPTLAILVAGLTSRHIGRTRRISVRSLPGALALSTVTPAVTCTVQAFMTGTCRASTASLQRLAVSRSHGSVAVAAVEPPGHGEMIWQAGRRRDAAFTSANLFWWYNMAASHDIGVTRGRSTADGETAGLLRQAARATDELTARFGPFPYFISGARRRRLRPRAGSPMPPCMSGARGRRH